MTPTQFFEKFDLLSELPNAVGKMRELILDLAVRGKIEKECQSTGHTTTAVDLYPFDVPRHWKWYELGELGFTQTGTTPKASVFESSGNDIPLIKPANIKDGHVNYSADMIPYEIAKKYGRIAIAGSIFMVCIGTIGKCGITYQACSFNQQINSITPNSHVNSRYLLYCFRAGYFQKLAWAAASRTTIAIINKGKWAALPIPLPPLAEQKRIVAKVDEMMALCDRLEAQQKQREAQQAALVQASLTRFTDAPTPTNLEFLFHKSYAVDPAELRKTILALAVQGKLVPQDPNDEPAEDLLHSFRKDQVSCWPKKYEEPQGFSGIHLPHLPSGWHWYRAEQVCGYITKGTTPEKTKMHSGHGEVPFLKVYNLTFNGELDFSIHPTFISRDTHELELVRSSVKPNDVLMNIVGPPLGKVSVVTDLYPEWNINQAIAVFHPLSGVIGRYLCLCLLQVLELSALVGAETRGSAGQDNISLAQCRGLPIPLPPLAEQKRIVAKVEELMGVVDRLEAQLAASREVGAKLIEAVVAEIAAAA